MANTLEIKNSFEALVNGNVFIGKQGAATDDVDTGFAITVAGPGVVRPGSVATGAAQKIFDDDTDFPADWDYMHFWADQDCYMQVIGATGYFIVKIKAKVPFVLSFDECLFHDSSTTAISAAPTTEDIDSVVLFNNSGSTMSYQASFFD